MRRLRALVFALEGKMPEVGQDIEESITLWKMLGDRRNLGYALQIRGLAKMSSGDAGAAEAAAKESIIIFNELGDGFGIVMAMGGLAAIALQTKKGDIAFCLLGTITSFREKAGVAFPALLESMLTQVEEARAAFGERAEESFRRGYAMDLQQAVALALEA